MIFGTILFGSHELCSQRGNKKGKKKTNVVDNNPFLFYGSVN